MSGSPSQSSTTVFHRWWLAIWVMVGCGGGFASRAQQRPKGVFYSYVQASCIAAESWRTLIAQRSLSVAQAATTCPPLHIPILGVRGDADSKLARSAGIIGGGGSRLQEVLGLKALFNPLCTLPVSVFLAQTEQST